MNRRNSPRLARSPFSGQALLTLAAIGLVLALSTSAWACPGCKEALASGDGQGGDLVSGFFWSILFMLSMPFLIFGTFCTSMYIAVRRARAAQAKAGLAPAAPAVQPNPAPSGGQSLVGA